MFQIRRAVARKLTKVSRLLYIEGRTPRADCTPRPSCRYVTVSILTIPMQSDSLRLHYLLHSADLIEDRLHHQLAPLGIKPRQARILDALARMSRASQVELARAFDVSPASMSTMTARLVAAGFITREVDRHDIRSNTLRLSKKGSDLLDQIRAAWRAIDDVIENAIGPEKARELAEITLELRDALGGKTPGSASEQPPDDV